MGLASTDNHDSPLWKEIATSHPTVKQMDTYQQSIKEGEIRNVSTAYWHCYIKDSVPGTAGPGEDLQKYGLKAKAYGDLLEACIHVFAMDPVTGIRDRHLFEEATAIKRVEKMKAKTHFNIQNVDI